MTNSTSLNLIVGKWKTPNHSNREKDDTHDVKDEILKAARRLAKENREKDYRSQVGKNPDIDITQDGFIILKGREKYKYAPPFNTGLEANDFFVLRFIPLPESNETEIHLVVNNEYEGVENNFLLIPLTPNVYVLPHNDLVIGEFIDSYLESVENTPNKEPVSVIIVKISFL